MEGVVKLPIRQRRRLAWLALLLAASGMLLLASAAQAAGHRGAVMVKDIAPGHSSSITEPDSSCGCISYAGGDLTNVGGTLYFSADDGTNGFELWRSDGTARGTRMVKDINPGAGSSNIDWITAVHRILYFRADDGVHGAELWRSDGTGAGTRMVKDINPGGSSYPGGYSYIGGLTEISGTLYFPAFDDTHGYGLWRSDGTEAGTSLVKQLGSFGDLIFPLIDVRGTLYFGFYDHSAHSGLWRSDGTEAGTVVIKQGFVGTLEFTDFRRTLSFLGDDGLRGPALWRSDGTAPGTTMVKDFDPLLPCCFTKANDTLYFLRSNGGTATSELWRSNGTEAGTALVKRANGGFSEPTAVNGNLFLGGRRALWRSDGTRRGTKLLRGKFSPVSLTAVKRTLYFAAIDRRHGEELWRSNGTRKGTRMVSDIRRGTVSSDPQNLTAVGNTLFFTATDARHGEELWRAGPKPCTTAKGKCKKG
jgi:ELWxxDGT repeat protein